MENAAEIAVKREPVIVQVGGQESGAVGSSMFVVMFCFVLFYFLHVFVCVRVYRSCRNEENKLIPDSDVLT